MKGSPANFSLRKLKKKLIQHNFYLQFYLNNRKKYIKFNLIIFSFKRD